MPRPYASTVIDKPTDEVWTVARDFGNLASWNPQSVSRSEIEDGHAGDQVGAIRAIWLPDGTHVRERLLSHSDFERSYSYDFQTTPFEIDDYISTFRVTPVTDGDRTFAEWFSTFACDPAAAAELTSLFANIVYLGGLTALKHHVETTQLEGAQA